MMFPEIYLQKQNFSPEIKDRPDPLLNICVVIPCYNEPCLLQSLQSLWKCTRPEMTVEVFIVINAPENCPKLITERNLATLSEAKNWINGHTDAKLKFHLIYRPDLPLKFAGVGLARKIGMDEAVYRLMLCRNFKGIVTGFDADSTCDPNYLIELEKHFTVHTKSNGASIYFEHPISGAEYTSEHYAGIILYELHLRYLNQALRYARHPYAFHTIGSSFAVRMDAYVKQGGMNKRQAGEDFYFLQKIIELGHFTEINTTCIIPSPRESDRVPFGTGAAMKHWFADKALKTYCFNAFEDLLAFTTVIEELYSDGPETILSILNSLPISLQEFLRNNNFENELKSIRANSASLATFRSRFFRWFNAFKVIKYLNFTNEKYHTKVDICTEAIKLTTKLGLYREIEKPVELLNLYRHLDRSGIGLIQQ